MIGYLDPQDSFIGYYTDDYNKVLSSPVPPNQAIVFVDLAHGMLYKAATKRAVDIDKLWFASEYNSIKSQIEDYSKF